MHGTNMKKFPFLLQLRVCAVPNHHNFWHYEIKLLSQSIARLKHTKIHSPLRRRRWRQ